MIFIVHFCIFYVHKLTIVNNVHKKFLIGVKNFMAKQKTKKNSKKLTLKQAKFVEEYLVDFNGTQAAIRAKYSPKTAYVIAQENLKKPAIIKEIQRKQEEIRANLEVTPEKVIAEFAKVAFHDVAGIYNDDGSLKTIKEIDSNTRASITRLKANNKGRIISVRTYDKVKALESLAKHLGLFEKDNQQKGTADMAARAEIMKDLFRAIGGEG